MDLELDGLFLKLKNSTYEYGDYTSPDIEEIQQCSHPKFKAVFLPVVYSLALVVGLLGNGLVLAVLFHLRRAWSVTETFILHLAVADAMPLLALPFWAVEASQGWIFGPELCKLMGAIFSIFRINFYNGILLLACISLDRFLSIVHAIQMDSRLKPWAVQASCLFVWQFCLLLSIPDWVFLQTVSNPRQGGRSECTFVTRAQDWRWTSQLLYQIVGFLLPAVVSCCSCILLRLRQGSQSQRKANRWILALVVLLLISWTAYNITLLADTIRSSAESKMGVGCAGRAAIDISLVITAALGCLPCCLKPVLYACFCINFRRYLLDMLRCRRGAISDEEIWDEPAVPSPGKSKKHDNGCPIKTVKQTVEMEQHSTGVSTVCSVSSYNQFSNE